MANESSISLLPKGTEPGDTLSEPLPSGKPKRGFAMLGPELVREIARRGGIAAHRVGTAHEFSSDEARAAGRKGGLASRSSAMRPHDEPDQT